MNPWPNPLLFGITVTGAAAPCGGGTNPLPR